MNVIDPANQIPKYLQISEWLKELIQSERYKHGDKLPSEVELAKMCNVNRNTLRQAIAELVNGGMVRKVKGIGSFVESAKTHELKHPLKQISSFRDYFNTENVDQKTIVLEKGVIQADKKLSDTLILSQRAEVVVIRRLRTGDGVPYIYEESHLPNDMFPDILEKDLSSSLYQIMTQEYGIKLAHSHQRVRAVNLNDKIATLFNLRKDAAGFFIENITYNERNLPIELLYGYCRGDKYVFELELSEYQMKTKNSY